MKSKKELESKLATYITDTLSAEIQLHSTASLLVSGGSTPKVLFDVLSKTNIEWEKVKISLVDERFVPNDHPDQNGAMVKSLLLQNHASKATFHPLIIDSQDITKNLEKVKKSINDIKRPFTVVILGMGEDGHTASLFPDCQELDKGMDLSNNDELIITNPINAPHQRISFTRKALLQTNNLLLHCYGDKKNEIIDKATQLDSYLPYPIQGFINQNIIKPIIFWAK